MIMLVMNDGALAKILSGTAKFGGDAGLAVGMIGAGVKGATTLNFNADFYRPIGDNLGKWGWRNFTARSANTWMTTNSLASPNTSTCAST